MEICLGYTNNLRIVHLIEVIDTFTRESSPYVGFSLDDLGCIHIASVGREEQSVQIGSNMMSRSGTLRTLKGTILDIKLSTMIDSKISIYQGWSPRVGENEVE